MTKQEFLINILNTARTPGNNSHKEWAQHPTAKQRAQALLRARLAVEVNRGEDTTLTNWALSQLK